MYHSYRTLLLVTIFTAVLAVAQAAQEEEEPFASPMFMGRQGKKIEFDESVGWLPTMCNMKRKVTLRSAP